VLVPEYVRVRELKTVAMAGEIRHGRKSMTGKGKQWELDAVLTGRVLVESCELGEDRRRWTTK
jgi:hypothetical protein